MCAMSVKTSTGWNNCCNNWNRSRSGWIICKLCTLHCDEHEMQWLFLFLFLSPCVIFNVSTINFSMVDFYGTKSLIELLNCEHLQMANDFVMRNFRGGLTHANLFKNNSIYIKRFLKAPSMCLYMPLDHSISIKFTHLFAIWSHIKYVTTWFNYIDLHTHQFGNPSIPISSSNQLWNFNNIINQKIKRR